MTKEINSCILFTANSGMQKVYFLLINKSFAPKGPKILSLQTVYPSTRSRLTIQNNLTVSGDFISVLRVDAVQYSDTGYYKCMYSTKEDLGPIDMEASVYVYVPGTSQLNLILYIYIYMCVCVCV